MTSDRGGPCSSTLSFSSAAPAIGDNDIWIAATALEFGLPLVSNNQKHFARIAGLKLAVY